MKRATKYRLDFETRKTTPIYAVGPWWAHLTFRVLNDLGCMAWAWSMQIEARWLREVRDG